MAGKQKSLAVCQAFLLKTEPFWEQANFGRFPSTT